MRKIFATAVFASLSGALLFGGAFAWRTSDSARGAALVGQNAFSIAYSPHCTAQFGEAFIDADPTDAQLAPIPCATLIGPNGSTTEVGRGAGKNNGDFPLAVVGGEMQIRAVHYTNRVCRSENFSGDIRILQPGVIRPGEEGGRFAAFIRVAPDAPSDCQGQLVYYRVTVVAENPNLSPVDEARGAATARD
jgi:hypothetical protein